MCCLLVAFSWQQRHGSLQLRVLPRSEVSHQCPWMHTHCTLFKSMDAPKHMPRYRWCRITSLYSSRYLHEIASSRGEGQELNKVLYTLKPSCITEDVQYLHWLICNKNSPFKKNNLLLFLLNSVFVCTSGIKLKILHLHTTGLLQVRTVAVVNKNQIH